MGENMDLRGGLRMLHDVLEKKQETLSQILAICENQEMLYLHPASPERTAFSKEIASEKQQLIETVLQCDSVFQSLFDKLKPAFEQSAHLFPGEIAALQAFIKSVMETDVKIRAQEDRNKQLLRAEAVLQSPGTAQPIKTTKTKAYMLDQYAKNKRLNK